MTRLNFNSAVRWSRHSLQVAPTRVPLIVDPYGDVADSFHALRAQLEPSSWRSLVVVSDMPQAGRTLVAANLAAAFARAGSPTLLLEADFRNAELAGLLGLPPAPGLANSLSDEQAAPPVALESTPGLMVLPWGSASSDTAMPLLQRPRFSLLLRDWQKHYGRVVVDTPADAHGPEARVIAAWCDAAILVGRKGDSLDRLDKLATRIERAGTAVAGVVFNPR